MSNSNGTARTIILGIVVVVVATVLAAAAVLIFAPDGADIAPLVGMVGPTVAALGALYAARQVDAKVERVEQTTEELANGTMDAKIRAGIADVIPDNLLDDTYRRQMLARDRMRRKTRASEHGDEAPYPGN